MFSLNPLVDPRWDDLTAKHPKSSPFHRSGWLNALAQTYGYRPMVLTSTPPEEALTDGIVFCEVKSWITGNRLVSLPFADHVEPLVYDGVDSSSVADGMRSQCDEQNWKYVEIRPLSWEAPIDSPPARSQSYGFHTLSLEPSAEQLFRGLHKSCLQRRIRRAGHEQLFYERGHSARLISDFYRLQVITRRRHGLLPQPRTWFENLVEYMRPNIEIRLARKDGKPIASILAEPPRNGGIQIWLFR